HAGVRLASDRPWIMRGFRHHRWHGSAELLFSVACFLAKVPRRVDHGYCASVCCWTVGFPHLRPAPTQCYGDNSVSLWPHSRTRCRYQCDCYTGEQFRAPEKTAAIPGHVIDFLHLRRSSLLLPAGPRRVCSILGAAIPTGPAPTTVRHSNGVGHDRL